MTKIDKILWLAKRNLMIDIKFIQRVNFLDIDEKAQILFSKYLTLVKHWFLPYKTANSFSKIKGEKVFYNTPYGSVGYECMLAEQTYWISQLKLSEPLNVLDIGANVGYFTLSLKKLFPNASIMCFEPNVDAYAALKKNTENLSSVRLFDMALGNINGQIGFNSNNTETSFSHVDSDSTNMVTVGRIDDIGELKESTIDVLKLDVEGYELQVLQGAQNLLQRTRFLLMELNPTEYSITDLAQVVEKAGKKLKIRFIRNFNLESDAAFENGDVLFELI